MSRLKKPVDKFTSEEVLKKFHEMAYAVNMKETFEEAVYILYGGPFQIKTDLSRRMLFHCELCNKDMNSVEALKSHCTSGTHQKNKDKKYHESRGTAQGTPHQIGVSHFHPDSLQYRLMISTIKPVGLQMVEEYTRGSGPSYYKCNLCGAHGKIDHMYKHIIGKKHTDKYIKSSYVLDSSVLTGNEREELRERLAREEGVDAKVIRIIQGKEYYPYKWEAEGKVMIKPMKPKIKQEPRSPSPGPSRMWSSASTSSRRSGRRSPQPKSPVRSSKIRSPSLPSRSPRESPMSRRSKSRDSTPMSQHRARDRRDSSPPSHYRRDRRDSSPPSHYRRDKRDSSPPSQYRRDRRDSSPPSHYRRDKRDSSPPSHYRRDRRDSSPPSHYRRERRDTSPMSRRAMDSSPMSRFRNQSPPRPATPPPPPPRVRSPPPATETKEKFTQKFDLEELMKQFNFIVQSSSMPDSEIRTEEDAKAVMDLMFRISDALHYIAKNQLEDHRHTPAEYRQKLKRQKHGLEKIMGQIKYRMLDDWNKRNLT